MPEPPVQLGGEATDTTGWWSANVTAADSAAREPAGDDAVELPDSIAAH